MSRQPQNYQAGSTRPRRPSASQNGAPTSVPPVRPLQINRNPQRPTTPSSASAASTSPVTPKGPPRPMRSGLRERRTSEYSGSDRASVDSRVTRDSRTSGEHTDATRADPPLPQRTRNDAAGSSKQSNGRSKLAPSPSPISPMSPESELSPTSLAAIAAFRSFGRKRGMSNDSMMDDEYERQKARELEEQKARQQRLRDRVPGRKPTGKTKAGDIDGEHSVMYRMSLGRSLPCKF